MTTKTTRRQFLKLAGATLAGMTFACGGLTYLGTLTPDPQLMQTDLGGNSKMEKILIAYASKCGSTGEVAQAIGQSLCAQGAAVEVRPVKGVTSLDGYSAVILGSAIRMGRWLPEALDFLKRNQARLSQMPTAFFTVHMQNVDDSPASQAARAAYVAPVHELVTPTVEAFFAGKIDLARLSLVDRLLSQAMQAHDQDLRDWARIRAWADKLSPTLV